MSLFTKIASTMLGTKIAADTSKSGLPGIALGVVATRMMTRSPLGTILVGGAWLGHKLWKKKREIDALGPKAAAKTPLIAAPKPGTKVKAMPAARTAAAHRANGNARTSPKPVPTGI